MITEILDSLSFLFVSGVLFAFIVAGTNPRKK